MNDHDLTINDSREVKLKQATFEVRSIKRSLDFMMEENVHLKNRVAEILKNGFDKKMLGMLEIFQDSFISEDQLIGLLRNEVSEIEQLLQHEVIAGGEAFVVLCSKLKRLYKSMEATENQFVKLKADFNDSLL